MKLLRTVARGAVAGAVGTAAMDLLWYRRHRQDGGNEPFLAWETNAGVDSWEGASSPGQAGRRILESLLDRKLPDAWARPTGNAFHWATGVMWGAQYGLVGGGGRSLTARLGRAAALGPVAWLSSYVALPLLDVYKPIWEYDAETLAKDLSAHLLYGSVTAAAFAALGRRHH